MKICPFMSYMLGADGNVLEIDAAAQHNTPTHASDVVVLGYDGDGGVGVKTDRKKSSSAKAASWARPAPARAPTMTFSSTVMPENGRGIWKARPIPRRHRACGDSRVMSVPLSSTDPRDGRTDPASTLSKVVLPAPLGPTMPMASPLETTRSTLSSAGKSP